MAPLKSRDFPIVMAVLASAGIYVALSAAFFPPAAAKLGHDYEYFLPLLLAGKYWIAANGVFAVPHFSPAFCGGLPFLGNPQSIFYSMPQALAWFVDPATAFLLTTVLFAWLGGVGTFLLMRRDFAASIPAAGLGAVIFMFNGMLLHRMAIGHVTYHAIGLVPLLCHVLLTPLPKTTDRLRRLTRGAGAMAAGGAMIAYFVYAGAVNIVVPLAMNVVAIWLLRAALRGPVKSFWVVGAGAAVIGAALSAAKLAPAVALISNFPRLEALTIFPSAVQMLSALFVALFFPGAIPDYPGKHEMEFGVGAVPLILVAAGLYIVVRRGALGRRIGAAQAVLIAALAILLAVPLWLNCGTPEFAAWLKTVPYVGDNALLVRWFFIYLLPLGIGAGSLLDYLVARPQMRTIAALAGILVTVVPAAAADRSYYRDQPYDPARILAADRTLRETGLAPAVMAVGGDGKPRRNDGLVSGRSAYPCYEPIFGHLLQTFPTGIGTRLRNPACYIYGRENGCRPGDGFAPGARDQEAAFAAYRPFAYVVPRWQVWADWVTAAGAAAVLLGVGFALTRGWLMLLAYRRSSRPALEAMAKR